MNHRVGSAPHVASSMSATRQSAALARNDDPIHGIDGPSTVYHTAVRSHDRATARSWIDAEGRWVDVGVVGEPHDRQESCGVWPARWPHEACRSIPRGAVVSAGGKW